VRYTSGEQMRDRIAKPHFSTLIAPAGNAPYIACVDTHVYVIGRS
jgi:hypothetical protein